jgi:protein-disulfide isomerase
MVKKFVPVLIVLAVGLAFATGWLGHMVFSLQKEKVATPQASNAPAAAAAPTVTLDQIKGLYSKGLIQFGDANRKVLFVEVSDPSCPYCQIASGNNPELATGQFQYKSAGGTYVAPVPEMKKLVDAGKASLVYIYTPGHGNGEMGMRALYCANDQNKFWQVNDLLMSNAGYELLNNTILNDKTKSQQLVDFLKGAADPAALKACIDSGKYDSRLQSDPTIAENLGVSGTPGFYVNTKLFAGAYSFTDMQSAVDAALK